MNLIKNSKCLLKKSTWMPTGHYKVLSIGKNCMKKSQMIHQKSVSPSANKAEAKELESFNPEKNSVKAEKLQRDLFGATILPQNLSFENAKKLSDNLVRLEDIPLVDESHVTEAIVAERMKNKMRSIKRDVEMKTDEVKKNDEGEDIMVLETDLLRQTNRKDLIKTSQREKPAEVLLLADPYEEIPGPKIFRSFMTLMKTVVHQLAIASLFRYFKWNALTPFRTYGPIVKLPEFFSGKIVLISRPNHLCTVLEQDHRYPVNSTLDSIQRSRLLRLKKNQQSDFHMTEEEWKNMRESTGEVSVKGSEKYFDEIDEAAGKFVRKIKAMRNRQNEVPDDFLFEINKWSLECLGIVLFDKSFGFLDYESSCWSPKTSQLLYSLMVATKNLCHLENGFQFWRFINTPSLSSLSSACDILENIISEHVGNVQLSLIKRRKEYNGNKEDLKNLSLVEGLLLQNNLSPEEIIYNVMDTLLIGMNTMSSALAFLLYHLSQNPQAQMNIWREIKEILPEKYSRLEYEQVPSLKFLQACLKESLRLKMPMPILTRVLSKNVTVSNFQIPKGTFVLVAAQVESMKEENFEDPAKFLPERWLDQELTHPYASLPIGNYAHNSFEKHLAEASIIVCACHILRHFSVEYLYEDLEATSTTISFPNKPLRFTFTDRKS